MKRLSFIMVIVLFCMFCAEKVNGKEGEININGIVFQESVIKLQSGVDWPLEGCVVQLFYEKGESIDSLYRVTSSEGRFSFSNVPSSHIVLKLRCFGFETQSGVYDLGPGDNAFVFTMKEQKEELAAATIVSEVPLMNMLKDTTIFNTKALKTMEGDGLRDALEMIPGFTVSDKGISVNGVPVSKAYVNGLLIFGDEAIRAVNALKADEVTQVKVYDQQSAIDKHRGQHNSKKEKVIDIITNNKFLALTQFGVAGSVGLDFTPKMRYAGALAGAYDSEWSNLEMGIWGSNILKQHTDYSSPQSLYNFLSKRMPISDDTEYYKINTYYTRYWKNRYFGNSLALRYYSERSKNTSLSRIITKYFEDENTPSMTQLDSSFFTQKYRSHILVATLSLLDTPLKSFNVNLEGEYTGTDNASRYASSQEILGVNMYGRNESADENNRNLALRSYIKWTNNDNVKWRPDVNIYGEFSDKTISSWTVDTLETSFHKRQLTSDGYGKKLSTGGQAGVSANLLNTKKKTLDVFMYARTSYDRSRARRITLDEWEVLTPITDIASSYDYTRNELTSGLDAGLNYSTAKKRSLFAKISLNDKIILNDEFYPKDFSIGKNFLYPSYELNFSMPEWDIRSTMSALTPSVEQISNRISDSNPLILTGGNPNLRHAYSADFSVSFHPNTTSSKSGKTRMFLMNVSASCTFSSITNRVMYFSENTPLDEWDGYVAQKGSMLYTFQNATRPSFRVTTDGRYETSFFYNKLRFKVFFSDSYSQTNQFSGNTQTWIEDWSNSLSFVLAYRTRRFEILEKPGITYIRSSDNKSTLLSSRLKYVNSLSTKWRLTRRIGFECEYQLSEYDYLSGYGKDDMTHILNAELSFKLLKDRSLIVSIQGIDLLNSMALYSTSINASYMTQTWSPTYGRYILLNVYYIFRKKTNDLHY